MKNLYVYFRLSPWGCIFVYLNQLCVAQPQFGRGSCSMAILWLFRQVVQIIGTGKILFRTFFKITQSCLTFFCPPFLDNLLPNISRFFSLSYPFPFPPTPNRGGSNQNLEWNKCEPGAVAFQPFFKCDVFANGFADNKYVQSSKCDVLSK